MFKQLKIYYFFIALPYVLVLCGAAIFVDGIKYTIVRNPHPQINYTIFSIILIGGILILLNSRRLMREARAIVEFFATVRKTKSWHKLQELANSYTGETACLLQMVASSGGRFISHQEQVAIENELSNTRSSLLRRNALPSYLTGLLVGMGLLGTFIGLLATLNDISILISSFADLDMQNASPMVVFRTMIERMKAPMQSMGIAFSASMFGLLGSIILGLMMVGIRRLQGDIFSVLSSEVARHIEIALSHESVALSQHEEQSGALVTTDLSKALFRIEERYAEASRSQQRALTVLVDDIQKQRSDLLRALAEQVETNNSVRAEMQQANARLGSICNMMEKNDSEILPRLSELVVQVSGGAKEQHKLLSAQLEEQRRLLGTLESYNIDERLSEATRTQGRTLATVVEDMKQQRDEMLRALTEQTSASNNSRSELQQLTGQLENILGATDKGNRQISEQLSELTVQATADAKESHLLLNVVSDNVRIAMGKFDAQVAESFAGVEQTLRELSSLFAQFSEASSAESSATRAQAGELGTDLRDLLQELSGKVSRLFTQTDAVKVSATESPAGQES